VCTATSINLVVRLRTTKCVLAKNAVSTEHSDALGGAPLAMVGFLAAS
jgi:hypothetical protein